MIKMSIANHIKIIESEGKGWLSESKVKSRPKSSLKEGEIMSDDSAEAIVAPVAEKAEKVPAKLSTAKPPTVDPSLGSAEEREKMLAPEKEGTTMGDEPKKEVTVEQV